ncbi:hypothetical protein SAMN05428984_0956 [Sphingomonas sp. OK281]|nr:hypothetical protein SAMN05428984_0956 [Sphingomonas sp. OK281]
MPEAGTLPTPTVGAGDGRRFAGAVAGALVAGIGITALLMSGERKSGTPSELADIERAGLAKLGQSAPADDAMPDPREQAVIQGGHLLLSGAAGVAYALATDEEASVVASGIGFGLAFYAAMHWVAGPLLGLKAPEWRSDKATIGTHTLLHVGFGLVTAAGAKLAAKR